MFDLVTVFSKDDIEGFFALHIVIQRRSSNEYAVCKHRGVARFGGEVHLLGGAVHHQRASREGRRKTNGDQANECMPPFYADWHGHFRNVSAGQLVLSLIVLPRTQPMNAPNSASPTMTKSRSPCFCNTPT